ncbi:hypothetical protein AVEN_163063-1, partial [Araneus ventricosus]
TRIKKVRESSPPIGREGAKRAKECNGRRERHPERKLRKRSKTLVLRPDPVQLPDRCGQERSPGARKHAPAPMNGTHILLRLLCILVPGEYSHGLILDL